jgi:hypothetical protein
VAKTLVRADKLGRDVDDPFAVGQQPVRDMAADTAAAFDRPDPVGELPAIGEHRPVSGGVGGVSAAAENGLVTGHHLDRRGPLVRVHPDHHCTHQNLHHSTRTPVSSWEGTATSSYTNPS